MQATVVDYDSTTGSGQVVCDDGVVLPFAAEALAGSGLRLLRSGQRVRIAVAGTADTTYVDRLQILTLR